jgi:ribosomal-protein-alanine N-acetyltransferase
MPRLADPVVAPGVMSAREQPTLSRDGLVLRPFVAADLPTLVAAYSEPSIQQWHVASLTDFEAEEWIASRPELWRTETLVNWAITVDSAMVGRVGLKSIDLDQGTAEITYWVLAEHRRNGYARRAVAVVTDWAFNDLGLHRIELTHSTRNTPSCGVACRPSCRRMARHAPARPHRSGQQLTDLALVAGAQSEPNLHGLRRRAHSATW